MGEGLLRGVEKDLGVEGGVEGRCGVVVLGGEVKGEGEGGDVLCVVVSGPRSSWRVANRSGRMAYRWGDAVSGICEFGKARWGIDIVRVVDETGVLEIRGVSCRLEGESRGEWTYL